MNHHMAFMAEHFVLNLSLLVHLQYYHASHIVHTHVIEKNVRKQVKVQLNILQPCLTSKEIPCLVY